ncbi:MAG: DNA replication and repair protein RecF, partial [Microthrixaceae bacterium]|nr:DNA replication and repair protein RecF [Microthrixaceae bacterium]
RSADLIKWVLITVFAPTDLDIVKGGPALRRGLVDQLLISMDPRHDALRSGFEKALRQRNALLKQVHGKLDDSASVTLDVWDAKLVEMGEALASKRIELLSTMAPFVERAYGDIAGVTVDVGVDYKSSWHDIGLVEALKAARVDDLRRGVTTVGPHRDDIELTIDEMPARTHASQGEQRTLALGLRLAGHRLLSDTHGSPPVLLLDDVFSELDDQRTEALLAAVPQGQRIITTATDPPTSVHTDQLLLVTDGVVEERTA